jgi:hypothetical protein
MKIRRGSWKWPRIMNWDSGARRLDRCFRSCDGRTAKDFSAGNCRLGLAWLQFVVFMACSFAKVQSPTKAKASDS